MTSTKTSTWIDCGTLTYGAVSARRLDDDTVRISYRCDDEDICDSPDEIREAVERALGVWIEAPTGEWSSAAGESDVTQEVELMSQQPTHEIRWTPEGGTTQVDRVALVDGAAYTAREWRAASTADWECDTKGRWTFQGAATPGGAPGSVEIVVLTRD